MSGQPPSRPGATTMERRWLPTIIAEMLGASGALPGATAVEKVAPALFPRAFIARIETE